MIEHVQNMRGTKQNTPCYMRQIPRFLQEGRVTEQITSNNELSTISSYATSSQESLITIQNIEYNMTM